MRIAVTYDHGQIFQHFGHTEEFKVYTIENDKVVSSEVVGTDGFGHESLAGWLVSHDVVALICGGIGGGAQMALASVGIQLFGGCSGDADAAVEALLKGELQWNPNVMCNHHHGGGEHSCGGHEDGSSCGHSCG